MQQRRTARIRRRNEAVHEISSTAWMMTFSDLLTLLLAFFVLRISVSSLDTERLIDLLKVQPSNATVANSETPGVSLSAELAGVVQASEEMQVRELENGTLLSLGGATFLTGSDELSSEAHEVLGRIVEPLSSGVADIQIAGHTDDVPISGGRFPSNWELSAARAISVARVLIEAGIPAKRISVAGYAHTKPVASNESDEGRRENRRVEVFVARE